MTARSKALRSAGRFTPISNTCPSRSTVTGSVTFPPRRPEAGGRLDCTGCQPASGHGCHRAAAPAARKPAGPTEPQGQRQTEIRASPHAARSAIDPAVARIAADLYWNNPLGTGRLRRAERHFLLRWLSSGECAAKFSSPEL